MLTRTAPLKRTAFKARSHIPKTDANRELALLQRAQAAMKYVATRAAVMGGSCTGAAVPKDAPLRSEKFRRAVASLPCAACGIYGYSQHAHGNEGKGLGIKTDDRTGAPLCCARPGEEGCHAKFDQYRLVPGGREAHREAMRAWGAQTRALVHSLGLWPKNLPRWPDGNELQEPIAMNVGAK